MFDKYSPDEGFALLLAALLGIILWAMWYYPLAVAGRRVRHRGRRWPLAVAPLACASLLYGVLRQWSAEDVRTDAAYMLFYMVIGAAWMGVVHKQLPLYGLSARDDVLERGNEAAGWVCIAALLGGTCCFAGANVGNGPGWWVVLFSAWLSTSSLFILWWLIHVGCGLAEKVTVERDPAAGLRAAGFFVGCGLILGRAVAGDWVSAAATTADFLRMAWPALVLAGAVVAVERSCAPVINQGGVALFYRGYLPAFVYVASGVGWLLARSS